MSDTYIDIDHYEYQQDLVCGVDDELCELTDEEFALFLAFGCLDQDRELN